MKLCLFLDMYNLNQKKKKKKKRKIYRGKIVCWSLKMANDFCACKKTGKCSHALTLSCIMSQNGQAHF